MIKLEARDATIVRGGREILSAANVSVKTGELKALVGPNGGGKSTLLRVLSGFWKPTSGSVWLDGVPLSSRPRAEVARLISCVPQQERITFDFTVEDVVAMGRYPHRGRFSRESADDRRAVTASLERCDIVHLRKRCINTLSGGEHQRVLIARSLAVGSAFILLDEPTASLDLEHSLEVLELCRQLAQQGKGVLISTHDLNAVARYAHSVVLIKNGSIVSSGARDAVLCRESLEETFSVNAETLSSADGHPVYVFHSKAEA